MTATLTPERAKREAVIRDKLPDDVLTVIDATVTDPGAPFEPAAVALLARLRVDDAASWQRARAMLKSEGVTIGDLDRMTAPARDDDGKQGRPVEWNDPEPWLEPVDGAAVLDDLKRRIEHYADLPAGGAVAVATWALYSWAFENFSVSPNLMITAPERESGKTGVTELLSWMVRRPKPVSDASAAAIIRGIERDRPALLFDEAQTFLRRKSDDPIRGVLLVSFTRRFANVERVEGDAHEVRGFSTFAPKAMNGRNLARVDDMLTSRSIVVPMTRATRRLPELIARLRRAARFADIYDTDFHLEADAVAERLQAFESACAKISRDSATLSRAAATTVALSPDDGAAGYARFEMDGMVREAHQGDVEELIAFARTFEAVGVDLLTLTLIDPPGAGGIEMLAGVVEGLR